MDDILLTADQKFNVEPHTICSILILTSLFWESRPSEIPWDKWSLSIRGPFGVEQNFRRHESIPVKSADFQCECPPHDECVIDFKINKDFVDLLNIRGIIKKEELKDIHEDLQKKEHSDGVYERSKTKTYQGIESIRNRRNLNTEKLNCCCPPKNVYMPTFITDRKFDQIIDKFRSDKTK